MTETLSLREFMENRENRLNHYQPPSLNRDKASKTSILLPNSAKMKAFLETLDNSQKRNLQPQPIYGNDYGIE